MIKGLTPNTEEVFLSISKLDFVKEFILVGGSALSLQLHARYSENLDFMRWKKFKNERPEISWKSIETELSDLGLGQVKTNLLGFDQVIFIVSDVKLSFYFRNSFPPEELEAIPFTGNINIADIASIGVMKIEVMLRRSVFRDYYDLFSILKNGYDIHSLIKKAANYSGHSLKTKNIISMLSNGKHFSAEADFSRLNPIYDVSCREIEDFIKSAFLLPMEH